MTTCHNCYKQTTPDCTTCPRRIVDNRTTLDMENENAAGMIEWINWQFAGFLAVVAIGLIIATNIFM